MARALALVGSIALAFGLGARLATAETGVFVLANVAFGVLAVLLAGVLQLRALRGLGSAGARRLLAPRVAGLALTLVIAVIAERALTASGARLDWTTDARFALSPATREMLASMPGPVMATHFHQAADPRARRTQMLLREFAGAGAFSVAERRLEESEDEVDRFGLSGTNAVVLELGDRFTSVDRPTEGTLLEGLAKLRGGARRTIYLAAGEGEADPEATDEPGVSGFAEQLRGEGYELRDLVLATRPELPGDAAALLVLGPKRAMLASSVAAIDGWLARGGRLIALLEPGVVSGLEPVLERHGFDLPEGVVIDPGSGVIEGGLAGANPVTRAFADHPVTRRLGPRAMAFFVRARAVVAARKPHPDDTLQGLVFTAPDGWIAGDPARLRPGLFPDPPDPALRQRWSIAAAGRYPAREREARIVVIGDADFATNRYLRALYNLDLLMNAVHWVTEDERRITVRPKSVTPDQDPLTPRQTLGMFYGVGLLLPELLLCGAALSWLRARAG